MCIPNPNVGHSHPKASRTLALKCILKILGKMFEVLEKARTKFSFNF